MKRIIILTLLLCFLFLVADINMNDGSSSDVNLRGGISLTGKFTNTLNEGLIFYMPMTSDWSDGANELKDRTPNDNHGTASNCVISVDYTTFNGTTSTVSVPTINLADDTAWSLSFWVNPTSLTGLIGLFGEEQSAGKYWKIYGSATSNYARIVDSNGNTTSWTSYTWTVGWKHFVITCDGTNTSNLELFNNGVSFGTKTQSNSAVMLKTFGDIGDGTSALFTGQMNEVRVYDRELSVSEAKTLTDMGH